MYRKNKLQSTSLSVNETYIGERIERKVFRMMNNKEPISDKAPLIYTERKDGVLPDYNIRTDRFDVALDAMDAVSKSHLAKRQERHKPQGEGAKVVDIKKDGEVGDQSIQATESK